MFTSEQAAPQGADSRSIEDRVGAWLGGPQKEPQQAQTPQEQPDQSAEPTDATSEQPQAESTAPTFEEVEYEGKTYQVPPELKEAIIRQSDYTKKTQEVANERKLIEHVQTQLRLGQMQQQFEQSVGTERQQLAALDYAISQASQQNWAQMSTDELVRARMSLDQLREQRAGVEAEIGKKQAAFGAEFQNAITAAQANAQKVLKERIPQWSEATAKEVRDWALSNGFTNEEVSSIYDPRHAEVLWKAAQYDKARTSAKPAVAQAKSAKVSSANPMPAEVRSKLDFRKAIAKTAPGSLEQKALAEKRVAALFGKR